MEDINFQPGANLRGALLRDANLRLTDLSVADFRDADLSGAEILQEVFFLRKHKVNAAKGNMQTKLPPSLGVPEHWKKKA